MALSTDYALRTAAFDPGDRSLEHTGVMGMACTSAEFARGYHRISEVCDEVLGVEEWMFLSAAEELKRRALVRYSTAKVERRQKTD